MIAIAVLAIGYITVKYILTERLVKATGDPSLEVRQAAARRILRKAHRSPAQRRKAVEFLQRQPQPVRDNVVWSTEQSIAQAGGQEATLVEWLVTLATDVSGEVPTGDADWDAARLAVQRLGAKAVDPLIERLGEVTQKTLEIDTYAHRRAVAARLLGTIGGAPDAAVAMREKLVEHLVKALRDDHEIVRQQAAAALARLNVPSAEEPLKSYLEPLIGVLQGRYICYVRLDSEGRLRRITNREDLVYGPFVVNVKPHEQANKADLDRQRDSALDIEAKELKRAEETKKRLEEGRRGQVIKPRKGDIKLVIEKVTLHRQGLDIVDPKTATQQIDLVEGEPMEVDVLVQNQGPGDLVSDFFVAVYGAIPPPKNHVDRPEKGQPYAGERARDLRALAATAEKRHIKSMYATDRPDTKEDDTRDTVYLSIRFNTTEADRIEALRQLMNVAHESCIPALGTALSDRSYTVRRQAAQALERILEARQTSAAARDEAIALLRATGLTSPDAVVRCQAAEALRLSSDPATVDALQNLLLTDRDATVRLVATRSLSGMANVSREKMLPALTSPDAGVRLVAPRLFSSAKDVDIVRQLLVSPDVAVAREALRTSGRLLPAADLIAALQQPDARVRALACQILSDRADPNAQTSLLTALKDSAGDVRAAAAAGLGKLVANQPTPDPAVVAALVGVVKSEAGDYVGVPAKEQPADPETAVITDKRSRAAAVASLVGLQNPSQLPEVLAALKDALADTNPDVLAAVLPAVSKGLLGDQAKRLIEVVEVPKDPKAPKLPIRVRRAGILAMWEAKVSTPEALDALVGLLNDPDDGIKTAAAVALIGLGDSRGDKVLRDQLTSKVEDVKRQAATLLATLPKERIEKISGIKKKDRDGLVTLIDEMYHRGSLAVNFRFIVRSLVFLGEQAATKAAILDQMKKAQEDPHPVMRATALAVLTALDDPTAAALAQKGLDDPNEEVRLQAARSAGTLEVSAALPRLRQMVQDPGDVCEGVRLAAQEAVLHLGRAD